VCQCEDEVVHKLEQDFKKTLQQQNSLEQWAVWLESVVQQVLSPYEGKDSFPKAARQFLLKWSFYRYGHDNPKSTALPSTHDFLNHAVITYLCY